jgi:hypothetical protein
VIIHTEGDKARNVRPFVVHVEGDPDHPINQGSLCSKGITLKSNIVNDRRLTKVQYRAPGSDKWEEKSWDFAIDRIARLMKDTRDRSFIEKDAQGHSVNALTSVGVIGGCTDSNPVTGFSIPAKVEYTPPVPSSIRYQYYRAHSISAGLGPVKVGNEAIRISRPSFPQYFSTS